MPKETKEPQGYGSGRDWVEGKTGGGLHDPKSVPSPKHQDFYDESRDSEQSSPAQGGKTSPLQVAESDGPAGKARADDEEPVTKVTSRETGAKRDSFFRKRDYE